MKIMKAVLIMLLLTGTTITAVSQEDILEKYIDIAKENNPELRASYKKYEQAIQRIDQSNALPDPQLSAGVFISPVETRVGPQKAKLSISQMFPWFGTLGLKKNAEELRTAAILQEYRSKENVLKYKVSRQWFLLYQNEEEIRITTDLIRTLEILERLVLRKYETAQTGMADILRIQMQIDEKQNYLESLKDKKELLKTDFIQLLNAGQEISVQLPDTLNIYSINNTPVLMDTVFEYNDELEARKIELEASRKQIEVARKNALPGFGLGLDYVIMGEREDMSLTDNGKDAIMPMVSISLPIYTKKYKAAIRENELRAEQADLNIQAKKNALVSEYEQTLLDYKNAVRDMQLYQSQYNKAKRAMRLLTKEYSSTGEGYDEVIAMQQLLFNYELKLEKTLTEFHIAMAYLNYLSGNKEL